MGKEQKENRNTGIRKKRNNAEAIRANEIAPKYATGAAKSVWLTFDDGPHASNTERVLRTLDKFKIKATFFVVGENARRLEDLVRKAFEQGHRIGNHSFTHPDLTKLGEDQVREEIQKTDDIIAKYTEPEKVFRP